MELWPRCVVNYLLNLLEGVCDGISEGNSSRQIFNGKRQEPTSSKTPKTSPFKSQKCFDVHRLCIFKRSLGILGRYAFLVFQRSKSGQQWRHAHFFLWWDSKRASRSACAMFLHEKGSALWADILYVDHRVDDDLDALTLKKIGIARGAHPLNYQISNSNCKYQARLF